MSNFSYHVEACEFGQVLEIWKYKLWPERVSLIEPISCITVQGEIDAELMNEKPYFWQALDSTGQVAGVISGFKVGDDSFRSRGIWVDPTHRKKGLGRELMKRNIETAQKLNLKYLWSMPRKASWGFYQELGFQVILEIDKYEFGPHFIAKIDL